MRKLIFVLASVAMLSLNACGKSIDTAEWTEEVKLSDGTMVTVWRKARAYSGGFPNSPRGRNIDFELRYEPLNVRWAVTISHTHVRDPVSFDIIDGVPHLTLYGDRASCRNRPPTDYTAQFLRWVNGQWVDVPQAQFPVDRVFMNLYSRYWGHSTKDDAYGLITWDFKSRRDGFNPQQPDTVKSYFERGHRVCERYLKS